MYIECKDGDGGLTGGARIGRVTFSKSGKSIYYNGMRFDSLKGTGFKANYCESETKQEYWISGCRKDGQDRLYGEAIPVYMDEDVRVEYWTTIRERPDLTERKVSN